MSHRPHFVVFFRRILRSMKILRCLALQLSRAVPSLNVSERNKMKKEKASEIKKVKKVKKVKRMSKKENERTKNQKIKKQVRIPDTRCGCWGPLA